MVLAGIRKLFPINQALAALQALQSRSGKAGAFWKAAGAPESSCFSALQDSKALSGKRPALQKAALLISMALAGKRPALQESSASMMSMTLAGKRRRAPGKRPRSKKAPSRRDTASH